MAAKKAKAPKRKKDEDPAAPKQEIDAVKGFILVMILLILCLGVFLVVKMGELDEARTDLANARAYSPKVRSQALEVQGFLDLISNSQETVLMQSPQTFFKNIYASADVRAEERNVTIPPVKEQRNVRERYTEYYWDIDIRKLSREQAAHFMWWVENRSPKAKSIEASFRRDDKAGEDVWDTRFRIGYRIATAK